MKGRTLVLSAIAFSVFLFICWFTYDYYHSHETKVDYTPFEIQKEVFEDGGYPKEMYSPCRTVGQQFLGNETERMETWTNARWYDGCHPTYDGGFRLYLIKNGSNELLLVGEEKADELMFLDHSIRVHHYLVIVECC